MTEEEIHDKVIQPIIDRYEKHFAFQDGSPNEYTYKELPAFLEREYYQLMWRSTKPEKVKESNQRSEIPLDKRIECIRKEMVFRKLQQ